MLAMDDLRHPKPKCKCGVEPTSCADPASLTARTTEAGTAAGPTLVFGGRFATGETPRPTTSASKADEGDGGDGGAENMSFDLF